MPDHRANGVGASSASGSQPHTRMHATTPNNPERQLRPTCIRRPGAPFCAVAARLGQRAGAAPAREKKSINHTNSRRRQALAAQQASMRDMKQAAGGATPTTAHRGCARACLPSTALQSSRALVGARTVRQQRGRGKKGFQRMQSRSSHGHGGAISSAVHHQAPAPARHPPPDMRLNRKPTRM